MSSRDRGRRSQPWVCETHAFQKHYFNFSIKLFCMFKESTYLCTKNVEEFMSMKAEEPMFLYRTKPTAGSLRGKIIDSVERETDVRVLQRLYVLIEQLKGENSATHRKIALSPRIKALSDVPTTEEDFDYKNDFVTATESKYI